MPVKRWCLFEGFLPCVLPAIYYTRISIETQFSLKNIILYGKFILLVIHSDAINILAQVNLSHKKRFSQLLLVKVPFSILLLLHLKVNWGVKIEIVRYRFMCWMYLKFMLEHYGRERARHSLDINIDYLYKYLFFPFICEIKLVFPEKCSGMCSYMNSQILTNQIDSWCLQNDLLALIPASK